MITFFNDFTLESYERENKENKIDSASCNKFDKNYKRYKISVSNDISVMIITI